MSGEAFAVERLREDPDLDYAALRRVADAAGITMQPIQYGRARKQLGLPPLAASRSEPRAEERQTAIDDEGSEDRSEDFDDRGDAGDERSDDDESAGSGRDAGGRDDGDQDDDGGHGEPSGRDEPAEDVAAAREPTADIVAPRRKGSPAFDFLVQELRRDGSLIYGTLRERAEARGFKIAPIMYGRAKAVLGLVPVKARGQGAKKAAAAGAAPRVLKQVESVAADRFSQKLEEVRSLDQLVSVVKDLDAERRRLRSLLERIVTMIDEALG